MYALLCLEKYSLSSHNKFKIACLLNDESSGENPLLFLDHWKKSDNLLMHQVGFLANSLLENICKHFKILYFNKFLDVMIFTRIFKTLKHLNITYKKIHSLILNKIKGYDCTVNASGAFKSFQLFGALGVPHLYLRT